MKNQQAMKYFTGDIVMKLGNPEEYIIVATKEDQGNQELEAGFDYLIQKESDAGSTEQVFEEDIERR